MTTGQNWDYGGKFGTDSEVQIHIADASAHAGGVKGIYDRQVSWNADTSKAHAYNLRTGAEITDTTGNSNNDYGALLNQVCRDMQLLGPYHTASGTGGDTLPVVGGSVLISLAGTTNAFIPITSTNYIGKPLAAGIDGQSNMGSPVFSSASVNFTGMEGYLITIMSADRHGTNAGAVPHEHIDYIVSVGGGGTNVTMNRNCDLTQTNLAFSVGPPLIGIKLHAHAAGMASVENDHPDNGLVLQATGAASGWIEKAVVDFRMGAQWRSSTVHSVSAAQNGGDGVTVPTGDDGGTAAIGTPSFEMHNIGVDPNNRADYAACGFGMGLGDVSMFKGCRFAIGIQAGFALGNLYDTGGNSDTIVSNCVIYQKYPDNVSAASYNNRGSTYNYPGGAATDLVIFDSTGFPPGRAFVEGTGSGSNKGPQLLSYDHVSGNTLKSVTGGSGTLANNANGKVKYYAYGVHINLGDQWNFQDTNIACANHAILVNVTGGVRATIKGGHVSGGGGGCDIVVASGKHVYIGEMYIDNIDIEDDNRGCGIWIVPNGSTSAVQDVVISPGTYFHINDAAACPVVLDGATGDAHGTHFSISGQTTGTGAQARAFLRFANGWSQNRGVVCKDIMGIRTAALSENAGVDYPADTTSCKPDLIEAASVIISTNVPTASAANNLLIPYQGWTTALGNGTMPTANQWLNGALIYDAVNNNYRYTDGTAYRLIRSSLTKDVGSFGGSFTGPDASQGDYFRYISTHVDAAATTLTMAIPTNPIDGKAITIEIKNGSGTNWTNPMLAFDTGTGGYLCTQGSAFPTGNGLADTKRYKLTFRYDVTSNKWIEEARATLGAGLAGF